MHEDCHSTFPSRFLSWIKSIEDIEVVIEIGEITHNEVMMMGRVAPVLLGRQNRMRCFLILDLDLSSQNEGSQKAAAC
jgi:hypothetical protein